MNLQESEQKAPIFNAVQKLNREIVFGIDKIKADYPLTGITLSISNHETNPVGLNIDIDSDAYKYLY